MAEVFDCVLVGVPDSGRLGCRALAEFNIALLLVCWIPVLYGVSLLASGERKAVDELRADALWFAVSLPRSYEHGFGYGVYLNGARH